MILYTINIELPSDILLTLNESEQELKQRIKVALATQLYLQKKVTIGKAAQIAELSRFELERILSENNISISNLEEGDIIGDIKKLSDY